jgi:hypothetical protein
LHAPESVGKCEGMNPHTPKATPTLGDGVSVNSQIFRGRLQGSKLNGLKCSLYHWKAFGTYMSKMGLHDPFWPSEIQVVAKRRARSQIGNLIPDH